MKITATYVSQSVWDITKICDQYCIDPSAIEDYWVQWDRLHIQFFSPEDGEVLNLVLPPDYSALDFDLKNPTEVEWQD